MLSPIVRGCAALSLSLVISDLADADLDRVEAIVLSLTKELEVADE